MNPFKPVVWLIQKYQRSQRDRQARDETFRLDREGKYAEAAGIYTRTAQVYIGDNSLVYQLYSHDSFSMWLKAKNPENALRQAGEVLCLLCDTGWISRSSDAVDDLSKMVGELYVAGYQSEASELSTEINHQLVAHGVLPSKVTVEPSAAAGMANAGLFPSNCPQCGGALSASSWGAEIKCPYCGSLIHASA